MQSPRRALLLVGSPKGSKSTSESLGTYLLEKLSNGGFETQEIHIQTLMRSPEGQQAMLELVKASDLLILAFPLYVDCLPAAVILNLELIAQQRRGSESLKSQRLVAIVNNSFPEASQNNTALAICRRFASEANIDCAGGLSLGGGGVIGGNPLDKLGFIARNVRKALDLTAKNLIENRAVPKEAVDLMAKPMVPKRLYLTIGNRNWKKQAKAYGSENKLYNQP